MSSVPPILSSVPEIVLDNNNNNNNDASEQVADNITQGGRGRKQTGREANATQMFEIAQEQQETGNNRS
jgi:hypothetical protein